MLGWSPRTASRPSSSLRARTGTSATCSSSVAAPPVRRPRTGSLTSGIDVLVVEKKTFPREKTCGDGLTPRSVHQLEQMGLADDLAPYHRYVGLRANAYGRSIAMSWPQLGDMPAHGYVITRADLDGLVAARAEKAGAVVWQGAEAVSPLSAASSPDSPREPSPVPRGQPLRRAGGAIVADGPRGTTTEVRARYVIVADGSLSRFGRALGHGAQPGLATGHGAARLLPVSEACRGVHRLVSRHPRRRRQSRAGIRLDLPARRRSGERRRRPALHPGPLEARQHDQAHGGLRGPGAGIVVPRRRDLVRCAHRWPPAHGPRRRPAGRTGLHRRRRCRRHHQPLQRRGHRLRLRDRPARCRRRRGRARSAATRVCSAATSSPSRTSTGSTTG